MINTNTHSTNDIPLATFKSQHCYSSKKLNKHCFKLFNELKEFVQLVNVPSNKDISDAKASEFLSLMNKANELIPECLIECHLMRMPEKHFSNDYYLQKYNKGQEFLASRRFMRVQEIMKLLYLKYEFNIDFDQSPFEEKSSSKCGRAYFRAYDIENVYFLVKAKSVGIDLSSSALKFVMLFKADMGYSMNYFYGYSSEIKMKEVCSREIPAIEEIKTCLNFLRKYGFLDAYQKEEAPATHLNYNYTHTTKYCNTIDNYVWRKWLFSQLLPKYDKKLHGVITFLLMSLEKKDFFKYCDKADLLNSLQQFIDGFILQENPFDNYLRHKEFKVFIDIEELNSLEILDCLSGKHLPDRDHQKLVSEFLYTFNLNNNYKALLLLNDPSSLLNIFPIEIKYYILNLMIAKIIQKKSET